MANFIRILGTQDPDIHIDELVKALKKNQLKAQFNYDDTENPYKWTHLHVATEKSEPLMLLERYAIVKGESSVKDIAEIKESIQDSKPVSAVKWLTKYLDKVKVIYTFQLLSAATHENNFKIIGSIRAAIWSRTGGILHADNEGFSNEEGFHIHWEFPDDITGEWNCAVRNWFGLWDKFTIDLGNERQRQEFQSGKVPKKAKLIKKY
jgi:hypothetical protein